MIALITGKLVEKMPHSVVIDTGGVGYEIFIPLSIFGDLPSIGQTVTLHTCFVVREQMQALFGFSQREDKKLFETLIQISGIGPKTAINILGHISPQTFVRAIHNKDMTQIIKVPGIGKKSAERLFLELRDKLPGFQKKEEAPLYSLHSDIDLVQDAVAALVNLGYSQQVAHKAIRKTIEKQEAQLSLAELITMSLSHAQ
jgi:Holliday junction DNA helicase RuvA